MSKKTTILFYKCPQEAVFREQLGEEWSFENAESLVEVREIIRGEPDSVLLFGSEEMSHVANWLRANRNVVAFSSFGEKGCAPCAEVADGLCSSMTPFELESRIYHGKERYLDHIGLVEYSQKMIRDRNIQAQMNDRLLKVSVELKFAKEKIEELSMTDQLTKVKNRRFFDFQLERDVLQSLRYETGLTLYILDIDNFKHINDVHGHQEGDRVLEDLADIIRSSLRDTDWAARYGGEEFFVILPMTDLPGGRISADRLRAHIESELTCGEKPVTISIGVATFSSYMKMDDLIRHADLALLESKKTGKNKVTYYDPIKKEYCESSSGEAQQSYR
ncbi:MAG: GGDEF domain-containing protein [Planctomycetes bacterium]|nr:GGDEF domain-containing protein [Planctomycetota bacterium]